MPHIQQLDSHVADLIAAGEVVERPASVVKELVENAIDAHSSAIVVELQRGGMGLIRVTDNGCGIAPEELPTAFLRHATSKLRQSEDLGRIGTLGFRGEALAAIAAVSRLDILSRPAGADTGASLHLEGGVPEEVCAVGAPEGTTILVRDLFYNTPARLKFMRKDSAETAAALGLVQHLALSHPEISFQFIKDGTEALHTPGDGKMDSAVYAALGRDFALGLQPVEGGSGDISVRGYVTKPLCGRGSRGMQSFFVNGRFIKSQLLTAALEEGYRNQIMKGRFPGCVLYIDLPVTAVDVNVHPAKTQVKFAREHDVFDAVFHTVLDTLDSAGRPAPQAKAVEQVRNPRGDFYVTMDAKTFRESGGKVPASASRPAPAHQSAPQKGWDTEMGGRVKASDILPQTALHYETRPQRSAPVPQTSPVPSSAVHAAPAHGAARPQTPPSREFPAAAAKKEPFAPAAPQKEAAQLSAPAVPETMPAEQKESARPAASENAPETVRSSGPVLSSPPEPIREAATETVQEELALPVDGAGTDRAQTPWRIAGEVLRTYIICEDEEKNVWLIDKHAAHERVLFDRLKARQEPPMRQTLLVPLAAELSREDGALLLENLPLLEEFGFTCEDFGDDTVLVREVPADIDAADTTATLEAFAEDLRAGRTGGERRDALLHTMACKAAIKAGMVSSEAELRVLVDRVQRGEIRYCPHGRPVAVKMSQYELEKLFKRA